MHEMFFGFTTLRYDGNTPRPRLAAEQDVAAEQGAGGE
jgi:hypothetical protein